MAGIRRALVLVSAERYVAMLINFGTTLVIARLLGPVEFGVFVLGSTFLTFSEVVRDFGTNNYLVQQHDLTIEKIRTAFTVILVLTLLIAGVLLALSGYIGKFYGIAGLNQYFQVMILGFLTGPFILPSWALFRRNLAFARILFVSVSTMLVNACVSISLAKLGFSYMSLAWANLASGIVGLLLYLFLCPDLSIFRPSLAEWRSVVSFGAYDCATSLLYRAWELLPYLIFGRILNAESVGLYQRSVTLCKLPENLFLASVWSVALPAFAKKKRDGQSLGDGVVLGLAYVTALLWPALLTMVFLAYPLVAGMLGKKWLEAVPLVQIIASASIFGFAGYVSAPVLVAIGAVRARLKLAILLASFSVGIQWLAAFYGLRAVAEVALLTTPVTMLATLFLIRRFVPFQWSELFKVLRKSAVVAILSAIGPALVVLVSGTSANVSIGGAFFALILAALGWLSGLWLTDHPFSREVLLGRDLLFKTALVSNAANATRRLWQ
jgi:O-antigen/teichoic acid export membrane protein